MNEPSHQGHSLHEPVESHTLVDGVDSLSLKEVDGERPHAITGDSSGAKKSRIVRGGGEDVRTDWDVPVLSLHLAFDERIERCVRGRQRRRTVLVEKFFNGCAERSDDSTE